MRFSPLHLFVAVALLAAACSSTPESTTSKGRAKESGSAHGTTGAPGNAKEGGTLTFALAEDPDALDPSLGRSLVGREVFMNLCEKLYDVNQSLKLVPQLAASLPELSSDGKTATIKLRNGVKFNDGTPMDAAAVKASLDRHRTLAGSARRAELAAVDAVDVVDPSTVRIRLKEPFAPLTATLADRAGMIMSPTQLRKLGDKFGTDPVCVGPFSFVSRSTGNEIVLKKAPDYYDASKVKLAGVRFKIITDGNVRLANVRSGDVDAAERLAPTDVPAVQGDTGLSLVTATSIGYQGITINIGNTKGVGNPVGQVNTALGKSRQLREAFELSLDRDVINKVVFGGRYVPDCSPLPQNSDFRDQSVKCPKRDIAKAKRLVQSSGVSTPVPVQMIVATDPLTQRFGQVVQSLAKEAGFSVKLQPVEFASALDQTDAGKFDTFAIGWSGRVDPDGDTYNFLHTGAPLNIAGLSDPKIDKALEDARATNDNDKRRDFYAQALEEQQKQHALIYTYRQKLYLAVSKKIVGLAYFDDGLPRLKTAGFAA